MLPLLVLKTSDVSGLEPTVPRKAVSLASVVVAAKSLVILLLLVSASMLKEALAGSVAMMLELLVRSWLRPDANEPVKRIEPFEVRASTTTLSAVRSMPPLLVSTFT